MRRNNRHYRSEDENQGESINSEILNALSFLATASQDQLRNTIEDTIIRTLSNLEAIENLNLQEDAIERLNRIFGGVNAADEYLESIRDARELLQIDIEAANNRNALSLANIDVLEQSKGLLFGLGVASTYDSVASAAREDDYERLGYEVVNGFFVSVVLNMVETYVLPRFKILDPEGSLPTAVILSVTVELVSKTLIELLVSPEAAYSIGLAVTELVDLIPEWAFEGVYKAEQFIDGLGEATPQFINDTVSLLFGDGVFFVRPNIKEDKEIPFFPHRVDFGTENVSFSIDEDNPLFPIELTNADLEREVHFQMQEEGVVDFVGYDSGLDWGEDQTVGNGLFGPEQIDLTNLPDEGKISVAYHNGALINLQVALKEDIPNLEFHEAGNQGEGTDLPTGSFVINNSDFTFENIVQRDGELLFFEAIHDQSGYTVVTDVVEQITQVFDCRGELVDTADENNSVADLLVPQHVDRTTVIDGVTFYESSASCADYSPLYQTIADNINAAIVAWRQLLGELVPWEVEVRFDYAGDFTGNDVAETESFWTYFGQHEGNQVFYSGPAHELLTGEDVNGDSPDIIINLAPSTFDDIYFDELPNYFDQEKEIPDDKFDFLSIMVREIGHALGVASFGEYTYADRVLTFPNNQMTYYDTFLTEGNNGIVYQSGVQIDYGNGTFQIFGDDMSNIFTHGIFDIGFYKGDRTYISQRDIGLMQSLGLMETYLGDGLIPDYINGVNVGDIRDTKGVWDFETNNTVHISGATGQAISNPTTTHPDDIGTNLDGSDHFRFVANYTGTVQITLSNRNYIPDDVSIFSWFAEMVHLDGYAHTMENYLLRGDETMGPVSFNIVEGTEYAFKLQGGYYDLILYDLTFEFAPNSPASGSLELDGSGELLTILAVDNSVSDPDGYLSPEYQWFSNGSPIPGATDIELLLEPELDGSVISVAVLYQDIYGRDEVVFSTGMELSFDFPEDYINGESIGEAPTLDRSTSWSTPTIVGAAATIEFDVNGVATVSGGVFGDDLDVFSLPDVGNQIITIKSSTDEEFESDIVSLDYYHFYGRYNPWWPDYRAYLFSGEEQLLVIRSESDSIDYYSLELTLSDPIQPPDDVINGESIADTTYIFSEGLQRPELSFIEGHATIEGTLQSFDDYLDFFEFTAISTGIATVTYTGIDEPGYIYEQDFWGNLDRDTWDGIEGLIEVLPDQTIQFDVIGGQVYTIELANLSPDTEEDPVPYTLEIEVPTDVPATGSVNIVGEPIQGETLEAVSDIEDEDGFGYVTYTWYADGQLIDDQITSYLFLTQEEVGQSINVVVNHTDAIGNLSLFTSGTPTPEIVNINDAPVSSSDSTSGLQDGTYFIVYADVLANDVDLDGDELSVGWVGNAVNGVVFLTQSGTHIEFEPDAGFVGTASFDYRAVDVYGLESNTSTVTITVEDTNDAPTGTIGVVGEPKEGELLIAVPGLEDADGIGEFSFQWFSDGHPIDGATQDSYRVQNEDVGTSITVEVSYVDGGGFSNSVTSAATAPVEKLNSAPAGISDVVTILEDTPTVIGSSSLLSNDEDEDADVLTIESVVNPIGGTVDLTDSGDVLFTPAENYFGEGSFEYVIGDGNGGISDPVSVRVDIEPTNDDPVGNPDELSGEEDSPLIVSVDDLLANDVDIDSETLEIVSVQAVDGGTVILDGSTITFNPDADFFGDASFQYQVSDGDGGFSASTAVVVELSPVNDAPEGGINLVGDALQGGSLEVISTLSDRDGLGDVTYNWYAGDNLLPTAGNELLLDQSHVGHNIRVVATYIDGGDTEERIESSQTFPVENVNDSPEATNDVADGIEDTELFIESAGLLSNDIDIDGDALSIVDVVSTTGGSAELVGDGIRFTPDSDFFGTASIEYQISDGNGGVDSANIAIDVVAQSDPASWIFDYFGDFIQYETVTAVPDITDPDGIVAESIAYQWLLDGTPIEGANALQFELTQDEVGGALTFEVSFTDALGNVESLESSPSSLVSNVNDAPMGVADFLSANEDEVETFSPSQLMDNDTDLDGDTLIIHSVTSGVGGVVVLSGEEILFTPDQDFNGPATFTYVATDGFGGFTDSTLVTVDVTSENDPVTGEASIIGNLEEDAILSISHSAVDIDGIADIAFAWRADDVIIEGADDDQYQLTQNEVGKEISIDVIVEDNLGNTEVLTFSSSIEVDNVNDLPIGNITVQGDTIEGGALTAVADFTDEDGVGQLYFQWLADGEPIDGATNVSLNLDQTHVGAGIAVIISYEDDYGAQESLTSADTDAVENVNDNPSGGVTISGNAEEDAILRAAHSLSDEDGLGEVVYHFFADGEFLESNSDGVLVLGQSHVDQRISVEARYIDGQGTEESVSSAATQRVSNVNDPAEGTVTVTGDVAQGTTLTASASITDEDGFESVLFRWFADDETIAGATTSEFTPGQEHVGQSLSVEAYFEDNYGSDESLSVDIGVVENVNDPVTGSVVIVGLAEQGNTLQADVSLSDLDGLGDIELQWFANGVAIEGATGEFLELTEAEVGHTISVQAGYTDGFGAEESMLSAATAAVVNVNDTPEGVVLIEGRAQEGETLDAVVQLDDADGLGNFSYQWLANGQAIDGATAARYIPIESNIGAELTVIVTYVDGHGTEETVTSAPTLPVLDDNFAATGEVTINGDAVQGNTLTVSHTLEDLDGIPGDIEFAWFASGRLLDATGDSLFLDQSLVGASIVVQASFVDGKNFREMMASDATDSVENVNDPVEGTVTISGAAEEHVRLIAHADLSDVDGLGELTYQWFADGETLTGATNSTLLLDRTHIDATITATVSFVDGFGAAESMASEPLGPVLNVNDAPEGEVTISGELIEDSVLSAGHLITDYDGIGEVSYHWFADGEHVGTGDELTLTQSEVGKEIHAEARYTDSLGTDEIVSTTAGVVENLNDAPVGDLHIEGATEQGERLVAVVDFDDEDGLGDIVLQWYSAGVAIAGANSGTYFVPASDIGTQISVSASYVDGFGQFEEVFSAPSAPIAPLAEVDVSGTVIDGYIAGAEIYIDLDGDGRPDPDEATGLVTDANGQFSGTVMGNGAIIAVGGVNTDTGLANTLNLTAPRGASVISPLTTLIDAYAKDQEMTPEAGAVAIAEAFGIDPNIDLLSFDPLAGGLDGLEVQKVNATLALATTLGNANRVVNNFVEVIAETEGEVDLTDTDTVRALTAGENSSVLASTLVGARNINTSGSIAEVAGVLENEILDEIDADIQAPEMLSWSLGDTAAVATDSELVIEFNEGIRVGSGAIILTDLYGEEVARFEGEALDTAWKTLTVELDGHLTPNQVYNITIEPGAILDSKDNLFVGADGIEFATIRTVPNTPAVGTVEIVGDEFYGATLSAEVNVFDAEGLGSQFHYQWLRNGSPIEGETDATYTVDIEDTHQNVSVAVSFVDRLGGQETLVSEATGDIVQITFHDGAAGADTLIGTQYTDVLQGYGGADTFYETAGNDSFDGGAGQDNLHLRFFANAYEIEAKNGVGYLIEGPDTVSWVVAMETLTFGSTHPVTVYTADAARHDLGQQVERLADVYLAFFNRAPDVEGLEYWQAELLGQSMTLHEIAASFAGSEESAWNWDAGLNNRDFVESVYQHLFDRAPDTAGWDHWTTVLDLSDDIDARGHVVADIILGAYSPSSGEADREHLSNKHELALHYTQLLADSGLVFDSGIEFVIDQVDADDESLEDAMAIVDYAVESGMSFEEILEDETLVEALREDFEPVEELTLIGITEDEFLWSAM